MSKIVDIVEDLRNIEELTSPAQEQLVSGTNIKTINSSSLLGSGDLVLPESQIVLLASSNTTQNITSLSVSLPADYRSYIVECSLTVSNSTPNIRLNDITAGYYSGCIDFGNTYQWYHSLSATRIATSVTSWNGSINLKFRIDKYGNVDGVRTKGGSNSVGAVFAGYVNVTPSSFQIINTTQVQNYTVYGVK